MGVYQSVFSNLEPEYTSYKKTPISIEVDDDIVLGQDKSLSVLDETEHKEG